MRTGIWRVGLIGWLLSTFLWAEPVLLKHRLYEGVTHGGGEALMVELTPLAKAFGLKVTKSQGGYLVDTPEGTAVTAGQVLVKGTEVPSEDGSAGPLVNLKEFSQAAGLNYEFNAAMSRYEVDRGVVAATPEDAPQLPSEAMGAAPGAPIYLNRTNPGAYVNLKSLTVRGKYTCIFLYKDREPDAGYKQCFTLVDDLCKNPEVVLYKINAGPQGTPLNASMVPHNIPFLMLLDKAGQVKKVCPGHSILSEVPNAANTFANFPSKVPFPPLQK